MKKYLNKGNNLNTDNRTKDNTEMINKIDVLIKCITLLYREKTLANSSNVDNSVDNTSDLIKTLLNSINNDYKPLSGGESSLVVDLKNIVNNLMDNKDNSLEKETLLQTLAIVLKDHDTLYNIVEKAIDQDMDIPSLKRSIISLRKVLFTYYKEIEITKIISKASLDINTNKINEPLQDYISKMITQLEGLNVNTKAKDPGVVDEIDIDGNEDNNQLEATISKVQDINQNKGKFITGWKSVNRMVNGGFRKGEQWVVSALQHNYKSGFLQSLFVQFCIHNDPVLTDPTKKPLIAYISFEDDANIIIEFIYRYLYTNEHKTLPDMNNVTTKDITRYVMEKLRSRGFYAKILRVNPSEWTYKNIFNKVNEWEAEGYEVQVLILDYLSKLPTTFCDNSGPQGTGVRDLFNRIRNFCSSKGILCQSAHQISTDALQMYRSGVRGFDFIDEISSKNYYSESKQIPQVVDGEIYLCKSKEGKDWYLYLGKGKHRSPIITPDEDKKCRLKFPKAMPIHEDLNDNESDYDNVQPDPNDKPNDVFDF